MASPLAGDYDMVAIRGGEADAMFDRAIEEMGGMRKYVKKGQTVVVKPNIGWDTSPSGLQIPIPPLSNGLYSIVSMPEPKTSLSFHQTLN